MSSVPSSDSPPPTSPHPLPTPNLLGSAEGIPANPGMSSVVPNRRPVWAARGDPTCLAGLASRMCLGFNALS